MTETAVVTFILTTLSTVVAGYATMRWAKPKQKVDIQETRERIEKMVTDRWAELLDTLGKDRERLIEKIEQNEKRQDETYAKQEHLENKILHVQNVNKGLKIENEGLRYKQLVLELEIMQIKKHNEIKIWKRQNVFLLDDDPDIVDEFRNKLGDISVVSFMGFVNSNEFMSAVKNTKPPVVIIDYTLDEGKTAEDIINDLGYAPEIFIMSINSRFEERFYGKPIKFFTKSDRYITKISTEVVRYLKEKT